MDVDCVVRTAAFYLILGNTNEMSMINNPPHILNKEGQMMPSALIPFCSFGSVMKGKHTPNISLRVCDLFDPVVLDGKLCYQMDMTKKMPKENTVQGEGLTLIIDANIDKSVSKQIKTELNYLVNFLVKDLESFDLREAPVETKKLAGINIGTLAPFFAFGPGNYILTAVKQMSATDGFLSLSSKKRECEKEKFETCQKRLFQESIKKCGCAKQSLIPALQDQYQVKTTACQKMCNR